MVVDNQVGSAQIEQNQIDLYRYPAMKRILEKYSEIETKPSDVRVGSTQIEQNQIDLDRYPAMKRILEKYSEIESKPSDVRVGSTQIEQNQVAAMKRFLEKYSEIESKPSDVRVGSTQIEQNQVELDRYTAMKRIREIESKPSDVRVGSTQIEQNQMELDRHPEMKPIREIESKPSDVRVGSMQLDRDPAMKRIHEIESKPSCRVGLSQIELNQIKWNRRRRILEDYREIESNPSNDFKCGMLERNPYEWQFGIRGASGTEFEGGIYHGRIQFPEEYPSKPPSFTLLTENGRFKTHNRIFVGRLNDWQPSWSVRDALYSLIDEMPTYPDGELGSVEYNKEERRDLAIKSRTAPPKYGTSERQKLIGEIHKYLLSKSPPVPVCPQHEHSQNDGAKRKLHGKGGCNINIVNTKLTNVNGNQVGFSDFLNKCLRKCTEKTKLDGPSTSRQTDLSSSEDE